MKAGHVRPVRRGRQRYDPGIKNIKTTYGYPDAYAYQLGDGTDVWVRNIA